MRIESLLSPIYKPTDDYQKYVKLPEVMTVVNAALSALDIQPDKFNFDMAFDRAGQYDAFYKKGPHARVVIAYHADTVKNLHDQLYWLLVERIPFLFDASLRQLFIYHLDRFESDYIICFTINLVHAGKYYKFNAKILLANNYTKCSFYEDPNYNKLIEQHQRSALTITQSDINTSTIAKWKINAFPDGLRSMWYSYARGRTPETIVDRILDGSKKAFIAALKPKGDVLARNILCAVTQKNSDEIDDTIVIELFNDIRTAIIERNISFFDGIKSKK